MTNLRTAAQQALEALEFYYDQHGEESDAKVITALRAALAAPENWELRRLHAQRDALLEALKYHKEQTRPIQRTIDAIKAAEENT